MFNFMPGHIDGPSFSSPSFSAPPPVLVDVSDSQFASVVAVAKGRDTKFVTYLLRVSTSVVMSYISSLINNKFKLVCALCVTCFVQAGKRYNASCASIA